MKTCSVYHLNQNRKRQRIYALNCNRGIHSSVYLYLIIVGLKDKASQRLEIPAYYFNVFRSILVSCFVYLIKS